MAKSDDAKRMILTSARVNDVLNRFYVLPPGTPLDHVRLLRKAFMETVKDPEFLADTQRAKLDLDPIDGDEIQKQVRELFKLEPALVAKMKELLKRTVHGPRSQVASLRQMAARISAAT